MTAPTPGQTIGPFFGYALPFDGDNALVPTSHPDAIRLHGLVLDGGHNPIPDALVEVWQSDANGGVVQQPGSLHRDPWTFTGWGRCATDAAGHYSFTTVAPGGTAAPFIAVTVFARGLLNRLFTRAYLPIDDTELEADRLLAGLPAERRPTLVAVPDASGFRFDIVLQGAAETVFLDYSDQRR